MSDTYIEEILLLNNLNLFLLSLPSETTEINVHCLLCNAFHTINM